MLTVLHPHVLPVIRDIPGGVLPIRMANGSYVLAIKLQKEGILAAKIDHGFRFYLAPTSFLGRNAFGLVTAFFDDDDEPLNMVSPLFADDELTVSILNLLCRDEFDVHFFDEHSRELLGYKAANRGSERFRAIIPDLQFSPFSYGLARKFHADISTWFSMRTKTDDDASLRIDFIEPLFPEDIFVMDARSEINDYHGYTSPMMTTLERVEPGQFQELDIVQLLQRIFLGSQIYLNPIRSDDGKEFVDVLVVTDQNVFLFQAKDSPNTEASLKRKIGRKISTAMGHLEKAVRQLQGSISYCRQSDHIKIITGPLGHKIAMASRNLWGLIVVKELFDGEQLAYSRPVLALAEEMRAPCIVIDYRQLHEITHHIESEPDFIEAVARIFIVGKEHGHFPRLRFGMADP